MSPPVPWLHKGDVVIVSTDGRRDVEALVQTAWPNGECLLVCFDGMIGSCTCQVILLWLDDTWQTHDGDRVQVHLVSHAEPFAPASE